MKKKMILSYDYELFFGDKSGTVQKTLIEPTNMILDAMESVGLKGNFFVDWQMLKYIKQENDERCQEDYTLIVTQLKDIIRRGHRIELHIHPHWVDAKYNGDGTWNFDDFTHYSLQSFSQREVTQMFVDGTNLLTKIVQEVDPSYKIVAFRAGGWAVQPFSLLKEGFKRADIKIDSSPCKGFVIRELHSNCDFRNIPDKSLYRFSDDICKEVVDGEFICIPITQYYRHIVQGALEKMSKTITGEMSCITDGTHDRKENMIAKNKGELKEISHPFRMLSLHTTPLSVPFMMWQLWYKDLLCAIQHPKDQTKLTVKVIKTLGKFVKTVSYIDFV